MMSDMFIYPECLFGILSGITIFKRFLAFLKLLVFRFLKAKFRTNATNL